MSKRSKRFEQKQKLLAEERAEIAQWLKDIAKKRYKDK